MEFLAEEERKKARLRAKALKAGRAEAAQWGELGIGAAIAPFAGPFGPIIVPNPKYYNDRKFDAGRATALARHVGAAKPWELSAGPTPHWAPYDAAADANARRAGSRRPSSAPLGGPRPQPPGARRQRQLPTVVRERLAAKEASTADVDPMGQLALDLTRLGVTDSLQLDDGGGALGAWMGAAQGQTGPIRPPANAAGSMRPSTRQATAAGPAWRPSGRRRGNV
jgi:hypothetical protein